MCRGARQMIADWRKCMTQSIRRYRASDDEQQFQVLVRNIIKSHLVLLYCFILLLFRNDATSVISLMHHYIYIYIWGGGKYFFLLLYLWSCACNDEFSIWVTTRCNGRELCSRSC